MCIYVLYVPGIVDLPGIVVLFGMSDPPGYLDLNGIVHLYNLSALICNAFLYLYVPQLVPGFEDRCLFADISGFTGLSKFEDMPYQQICLNVQICGAG